MDSLNPLNKDFQAKQKLTELISLPAISKPSKPSLKKYFSSFSTKPIIKLGRGYLNYSWNYRMGIDTPFAEQNISQHVISGSFNATLANKIPLQITYVERRSNSIIFRDFRDVRVELDVHAFQKLQAHQLRNYLSGISEKLRDPLVKPAMDANLKEIARLNSRLNHPAIKKKFIDSKELLIVPDLIDTDQRDSIISEARQFIAMYEKMGTRRKEYEKLYDSLHQVYISTEKEIRQFQQLMNGNLSDPGNIVAIEKMIKNYGIKNNRFKKLSTALSSIKTLAIGKTSPDFSNLTLKNTNVRGLNLEYNRNNFYLALAAGSVDYRVRDFVFSGHKRTPQFVYAGRVGYGVKEKNHIILTYYFGKKQIYSGTMRNASQNIKGISIATQLFWTKNHKINFELAQSATPALFNATTPDEKPSFNFNDKNNQAYSVQIKSYVSATNTKFEGRLQHRGVNFKNFSYYSPNASATSWYAKASQYFWKRSLHVVAAIRKNDFHNPFVLQRYNANSVFKNFTATFRKRNWPVLSAGLMPSSQYTFIDSLVYENRYQVLNATVSHRYQIGTAPSSTTIMYNRFYNDAQDSGFVYYNANNFYFNQSFQFLVYSANINISHTENGTYTLDVWDAGFIFKLLKQNSVGFGFKINHINKEANSRVGFYGNASVKIPQIGELNIWLEKNYLPDTHHQLRENGFFNISFTRYFN